MVFNPFTAIMLLKMTSKSAKFETLNFLIFKKSETSQKRLLVFIFALACQRIFLKMHSVESTCVIAPGTILFFRHILASFSPEILQTGAVKGLRLRKKIII